MKKNTVKIFIIIFGIMLMASCSSHEKALEAAVEAEKLAYDDSAKPIKGKLNVYSSMSRAVKYNIEPAVENIHKKLQENSAQSPQALMQSVLNLKEGDEKQLYYSVRILDFAILYAITRLSPNAEYRDKNLYTKAGQNLSLAAIRAHKDALFAEKKIKEVDRQIARENKIVESLNHKLSRNGLLSKDDLELKKSTEVYIYKLIGLRNVLIEMSQNYKTLVKATDDASLEGRHFYELEDFDERNKLETFQNAGIKNRTEFRAMNEVGKSYSISDVKSRAINRYPEIETLNLNGYNIKDAIYIENLQKRAAKIVDDLLNSVTAYEKTNSVDEKTRFRNQAFDEIGTAILAQIEIDYDIVRMIDADYNGMDEKLVDLRREVKVLERRRNPNVEEQAKLFDKKAEYLQMELTESQISAERAAALRALYFHSGLSPFNRMLMKAPVDAVEENLKISFNKDMIEMLAQGSSVKPVVKKNSVGWSDGDNWLEELVDNGGPKVEKPINVPQKTLGDFDAYEGESYNKLKIMQLGSYRDKANADLEWSMLKELYPQFSDFTPKIESTTIGGQKMYRLILRSKQGGFRDLCNQLRMDRIECLLR